MRQTFTPQELADHFTLLSAEQELLANTQLLPKIWGFLFLKNTCNIMYKKALFHFG